MDISHASCPIQSIWFVCINVNAIKVSPLSMLRNAKKQLSICIMGESYSILVIVKRFTAITHFF